MLRHLIGTWMMVPALVCTLGLSGQVIAQTTSGPTICKDGTTSTATGRGACSGHGGVQKSSTATAPAATPPAATATPGSASAPAAPVTPKSTSGTGSSGSAGSAVSKGSSASGAAPSGATAQCKDGSYSKSKHHSGACSHHGGVQQWLDGSTQ